MSGAGESAPRRKILVVGGARGIGAAIVKTLAEHGHEVVFTYRASADEAFALLEMLRGAGYSCDARSLDLADKAAVDAFADHIAGEGFAGYVHNAGQPYDTLAAMMKQDKAEAAMQVNFWAFTRLCSALVRPMTAARFGRIVSIGSVAALYGSQGNAAYAASKAALIGYTKTLAIETARRGVTVNCVMPGFVDTDMIAGYADYRATVEKQIPAGRFARAEEVAGVVGFLLSPAGSYVTGALLPVDGGLTASVGIHR